MKAFLNKHSTILQNTWFLFTIVFIINFLFRLININHNGLWYDESFGLYNTFIPYGHLKHNSEWDINAPGFYYVLWYWRHLFGISETALRCLSVTFMALTASMIMLFCKRFLNIRSGIYACILFLVCNEVFWYGQDARCYSILLFLTICSAYAFFKLLNEPNWKIAFLLGAINFCLIYTHYLTFLFLVMQALYMFSNWRFLLRWFYYILSIIVSFALTFIFFTKKQFLFIMNNKGNFWLQQMDFENTKQTLFQLMNNNIYFYLFVALLLVGSIGVFFGLARSLASIPISRYFLYTSIGSIVLSLIISFFIPVYLKRYLLFTTVGFSILTAVYISELPWSKNLRTFILLLFVCSSLTTFSFKSEKPQDYRLGVAALKQIKDANTCVILQTVDIRNLFTYHYDKNIFMTRGVDTELPKQNIFWTNDTIGLKLINYSNYKRVVMFQTYNGITDPNNEVVKQISKQYKINIQKNFGNELIYTVFEKR